MSVSTKTGGNVVDLDAIVTGGDAFMSRLKALKEAKAAHDEAVARFKLGNDVVRAMQDVQAREQAVMDQRAAVEAEAAKIVADAKAEADRIRADAKAEADALAREVDEARAALATWSKKTRDETNALMAEAVAAKADADRIRDAVARAVRTLVTPGTA